MLWGPHVRRVSALPLLVACVAPHQALADVMADADVPIKYMDVLNQSEDRPLVAFMTNEAPHLVCGEMPAHDATASIWLHGLARSRRSQRMT